MARTLLVGDIHSCYDQLIELLEKVKYTRQDRLILLGDAIENIPNVGFLSIKQGIIKML